MTSAASTIDYSHRFHAGNVGDVWKHCALIAMLKASPRPIMYFDTHAGEADYQLGPTGEWTEGLGKLLSLKPSNQPALEQYLQTLHAYGVCSSPNSPPRRYPGSPRLALSLLNSADDQVILTELVDETATALKHNVAQAKNTHVVLGNGLTLLSELLSEKKKHPAQKIVLIDPPYSEKQEWLQVGDVLAKCATDFPEVHFVLWYPIKSLTRPEAMLKKLRQAHIPLTALDLLTTPLDLKKNRLNGSGLIFVRPLATVITRLTEAAPILGAACATHQGWWSLRAQSWT